MSDLFRCTLSPDKDAAEERATPKKRFAAGGRGQPHRNGEDNDVQVLRIRSRAAWRARSSTSRRSSIRSTEFHRSLWCPRWSTKSCAASAGFWANTLATAAAKRPQSDPLLCRGDCHRSTVRCIQRENVCSTGDQHSKSREGSPALATSRRRDARSAESRARPLGAAGRQTRPCWRRRMREGDSADCRAREGCRP